jgi:hypothetical protein
LVLKLLLLASRLIGNHRSPIIAFATPLDHSITGHLVDLVGFASFPALLFRHPACRTISPHPTGPGHSTPHAITNACCGVAVETNNKWESRFRHHADASRYCDDLVNCSTVLNRFAHGCLASRPLVDRESLDGTCWLERGVEHRNPGWFSSFSCWVHG